MHAPLEDSSRNSTSSSTVRSRKDSFAAILINTLRLKLSGTQLNCTLQANEAAAAASDRSLAAHAQSLFDDPEFAELCDKGMNMQLQRTKNGATEKSRIAELAGDLPAALTNFSQSLTSQDGLASV